MPAASTIFFSRTTNLSVEVVPLTYILEVSGESTGGNSVSYDWEFHYYANPSGKMRYNTLKQATITTPTPHHTTAQFTQTGEIHRRKSHHQNIWRGITIAVGMDAHTDRWTSFFKAPNGIFQVSRLQLKEIRPTRITVTTGKETGAKSV